MSYGLYILANIWSSKDLKPVRHQGITCTNANVTSIGPLLTNSSEIWIQKYQSFLSMKCK